MSTPCRLLFQNLRRGFEEADKNIEDEYQSIRKWLESVRDRAHQGHACKKSYKEDAKAAFKSARKSVGRAIKNQISKAYSASAIPKHRADVGKMHGPTVFFNNSKEPFISKCRKIQACQNNALPTTQKVREDKLNELEKRILEASKRREHYLKQRVEKQIK